MEDLADEEFTVHDVMYGWKKRWSKELTEKEMAKCLPILETQRPNHCYLDSEHRRGVNFKYYTLVKVYDQDGNLCPLYTKRIKE